MILIQTKESESLHSKIDAAMCKFNLLAVDKSRSRFIYIYIYIYSELGIARLHDYILYMSQISVIAQGRDGGKTTNNGNIAHLSLSPGESLL